MNTINNLQEFSAKCSLDTYLSPFSSFPCEEIHTFPVDSPASLCLTDLHKVILLVLNQYSFLNSYLLLEALKQQGLEGVEAPDLQAELRKMHLAAYVEKMEFTNQKGTSTAKYYYIGYRGRGWLSSVGRKTNLYGYLPRHDAASIKRIISANQYAILSAHAYRGYSPGSMIKPEDSTIAPIRMNGMLNTGSNIEIIESVRSDGDWQDRLTERLGRLKKVILSNREFFVNLQIIIIAENSEHMCDVISFIQEQRFRLPVPIVFSNDGAIYENGVNCLYSYNPPPHSVFDIFKKLAANF